MAIRALFKASALLAAAVAVSACTADGPREGFAATDPFEPTNRAIHSANTVLDRNLIRPAAQGYDFVTPTLFKHLIGNGLSHLTLPRDFANYVLQADTDGALETLGRFTLNTVLGAGGLLDPATEFGLPKQSTDFGITLGKYGVGEGPFLILPLLGPSTLRDTTGFVVDQAFSPSTYVGSFTDVEVFGYAQTGFGILDGRNRNADLIDEALYESIDSYVTVRSGYLQRRRSQIAGEEGALDQLPDIFDEPTPTQ